MLSNKNRLSDKVKFSVIDLLELYNYVYTDDNLIDTDDDDIDSDNESFEQIKFKVSQRQLAKNLHELKTNKVIINLIGRNDVNEVIIKKILPGSACKMVTFRWQKKKVLKKHLSWLDNLGFRREYYGIKGYLGDSKFKVSIIFILT